VERTSRSIAVPHVQRIAHGGALAAAKAEVSVPAFARNSGSAMMARVPPAGPASSEMRPPWASAALRAMAGGQRQLPGSERKCDARFGYCKF
jgi:hypothetical protein